MIAGLVGHYRVESTLGAGGMGVVYKAVDTRLNRPVAIKAIRESDQLDARAVIRLRAEALAAASLDHPYICKIFELLDTDAGTLIVMEFVEGETLSTILARGIPQLGDALRYGSEIAEGLANAHARGLVHRDVKPSNVMITSYGHVKLLDFGVARVNLQGSGDTSTHSTLTRPGAAAGTPLYMAPEQALGGPVDPRADLFSLGIVLFEMLTGQLPFEGVTRDAYVHAMLTGRMRSLGELAPDLPENVRRIVRACLQGEKRRRPESASVVASELRRAADLISSSGTSVALASSGRWKRTIQALGLLVGLGALAGAYAIWHAAPAHDAAGRTTVPATTWPSEEYDGRISPDGKWLSFLSNRDGTSRIFMAQLGAADAQPVESNGEVLSQAWSPDGRELVCVLRQPAGVFLQIIPAFFGGTPIRSVALPASLEAARVVRWVGDGVYLDAQLRRASHSLLHIDTRTAKFDDISARWAFSGDFGSFDVGPDGKSVVFSGSRAGVEDLWVTAIDRPSVEQLTNDEFADRRPLWRGNSRTIVYQSNRSGQIDLWEMAIDGHRTWQVTSSQTEEVPTDVSPDGRTMTYDQRSENASLWTLSPRADAATQLTANTLNDFLPALSTSSDVLAFQRTRPAFSSGVPFLEARIFVSRTLGTGAALDPRAVAEGFGAALSPDGQWLSYERYTAGPAIDLHVKNLQTGEEKTLAQRLPLPVLSLQAPIELGERIAAWAPSGADLYFAAPEGDHWAIRRFDASTGVVLTVVTSASSIRDVRPSSEPGRIAYLCRTGGEFQLHEIGSGQPDQTILRMRGISSGLFFRGSMSPSGPLVLLRSLLQPEGPDAEVVAVLTSGSTRQVAMVKGGYAVTGHLDPAGGVVYLTRAERQVYNIVAVAIATGRINTVTDNQVPGVSFSGIQVARDGRVIFSRNDTKQDIWIMRTPGG